MSQRNRIGVIADEIREVIGRLLANAKPVCVPLDFSSEVRTQFETIEPLLTKPDYKSRVTVTGGYLIIHSNVAEIFTGVEPSVSEIDTQFHDGESVGYPVNQEGPEVIIISGFTKDPDVRTSDDLEIDGNVLDAGFEPLEPGESEAMSKIIIGEPTRYRIRTKMGGVSRNGIVQMRKYPITMHPVPWSDLGKKFIVEAWDRLKARAKMKLGKEPGKKLEMTAIFTNVDFSVVKKVSYDHGTRTLKLQTTPPEPGRKNRSGNYAIIIGLLRGTGEVLQVAMKQARG